jgi:hypothetical protein
LPGWCAVTPSAQMSAACQGEGRSLQAYCATPGNRWTTSWWSSSRTRRWHLGGRSPFSSFATCGGPHCAVQDHPHRGVIWQVPIPASTRVHSSGARWIEAVLLGGRIQVTPRCGLVLGSTKCSGSYRQADVALVDQITAVRVFDPSGCSVVMLIPTAWWPPRWTITAHLLKCWSNTSSPSGK